MLHTSTLYLTRLEVVLLPKVIYQLLLRTSRSNHFFAVGQLPQTSYQSLLTPYVYFGLGRTNNYIENLFVGSTKHTDQHYINMEGVIPNSKVVINPPIKGDDWRRELYLRPGEWIPWVTLTVVVATILLAAIVFVLHLHEKVSSVFVPSIRLELTRVLCCREKTSWSADERRIISTLTRCKVSVIFDVICVHVVYTLFSFLILHMILNHTYPRISET